MRFIDAHLHVKVCEDVRFYNDFDFFQLEQIQKNTSAKWNFIMINPTPISVSCPVDSWHFVSIQDTGKKNTLSVYCTVCGKEIYRGTDPYHEMNVKLLNKCKDKKEYVPFITLAMSNNTIPYETNFFEQEYGMRFCGYKLHPALNMRSPLDLHTFDSKRPVIIHSGSPEYTAPYASIEFAKRYEGNVDVAHMACFNNRILSMKTPKNIYFDTSPLKVLLKECLNGEGNKYLNASEMAESDLKKVITSYLQRENVMFGTDVPWSNRDEEIEEIKKYIDIESNKSLFINNALQFVGKYIVPFLY